MTQQLLHRSDGVLCDQLGRMVVQVSDGSSGRHSREHTSNTITPTRVGSSLDADAVLDGSGNEWWLKYDLIALCMTIHNCHEAVSYHIIG